MTIKAIKYKPFMTKREIEHTLFIKMNFKRINQNETKDTSLQNINTNSHLKQRPMT